MNYEILLYYLYAPIADPEALRDAQRTLCESLNLKGRIIISHEGLNGTVEGTAENTAAYIEAMHADPLFKDVWFKRSEGTGAAFPRLSVKARTEIVSTHLGELDVKPWETTGKYLTAEELHEWIHSRREFYIVDMRNDFEHAVGHFKGSVLPPMHHFRELPEMLPQLEHLRDKTVLTVCTGGVRCEKASGFLIKHGFRDVYQLHGGIVTYMEKYPNEDFQGKLYVFDGRITMGFNTENSDHAVVGRCEVCNKPSEHYTNCADDNCHRHFIVCETCLASGPVHCPKGCTDSRHKRDYSSRKVRAASI